jgi:opacity protein-like surface antigen
MLHALKKFLLGAGFATAAITVANAQDWSGWYGGISVGGVHTQFDTGGFSDGSQFCATETSGPGVSASCRVGPDFSEVQTRHERDGSVYGSYQVYDDGSVTQTFENAVVPPSSASGTQISITTLTPPDPVQNFMFTQTSLQSPSETSTATGIATQNIFDFGTVPDLNTGAPAVGAHLRRDWQMENGFVFGLEGEISLLFGESGRWSGTSEATFDNQAMIATEALVVRPQALGSVRIRAGHAMGGWLPYITAGVGVGAFEADLAKTFQITRGTFFTGNITDNQTVSKVAIGGVVGGGVAVMLNDSWTLSGEGLYYFFNDDIEFSDGQSIETDSWSAMLKLSMKLN